ncbi:putative ABC transport system ATP-binding protein [Roseateles sp. YR242]|uniref:ABC transporter ATP-binding protein n=1 Tax=Roseateles sp. YR242 TaxID=1855305 RepID=UPI0008D7C595|nr:ABC transporter ATP-binding protein [Roseateles sp. YR242]SEK27232.1 putative ABC transport system ATP-binding protein [Roseateles sp. YR242]
MPPPPLLQATGLTKRFGGQTLFEGLDLRLQPGELLALLGESGSGKSTLLNGLAALEPLDEGQVLLDGQDILRLDEAGQALLRRERLGFVFQAFHVLPHLTVRDNIGLPLLLQGRPDTTRVDHMLGAVGLAAHANHLPRQLSGGQLQRVAIARALVHRPALVLADEPTGNLDPRHADQMMQLLRQQLQEQGAACLLVTHSAHAAALADRRLRLDGGQLVDA